MSQPRANCGRFSQVPLSLFAYSAIGQERCGEMRNRVLECPSRILGQLEDLSGLLDGFVGRAVDAYKEPRCPF
jgi:hypothetical protein